MNFNCKSRLSTALVAIVVFVSCDSAEPLPAESVYVSADGPNALVTFDFKNYLGNNENIHPKVLYFADGWNGYEYWMAYTPYPLGSTVDENPCIAVSHNGVDWIEPVGLVNPLAFAPEQGYNSDTHLVYDEANDVLECWWRPCDTSGKVRDAFMRRLSTDGVNWGEEQLVYDWGEGGQCRLSPAVSIVDGAYYLVYSDCRNLFQQWGYVNDAGNIDWEPAQRLDVPVTEARLSFWHQDFIIDDDRNVEMVICAFTPGGGNNTADLYYTTYNLDDTGHIAEPELILSRGESLVAFDNRAIYRSSIVKVDQEYMIYYSAIDNGWHRYMSLTTGSDIRDLHGVAEFVRSTTGVARVCVPEFAGRAVVEVFDLNGVMVTSGVGELYISRPGVYIVRCGLESRRVVIR